jgi:hypothetical protein
LTVSAATITGPDASKFGMVGDSCTQAPVPAGGSCVATMSFAPGQDYADATAAITFSDDSASGAHTVALAATVRPGHTSWDTVGDAGDTLLGPHFFDATPATARFSVAGTSNRITAQISLSTQYGTESPLVTLTVPAGQSLAAGDYPATTSAGSTSGPGLSVVGSGSGCASQVGSFHLDEVAFDPDTGELTALALTFVDRCSTSVPAAYGSIAWQATDPAPERAGPGSSTDTVAPGAPIVTRDRGGLGTVQLYWTNPADADFNRTIVRESVGITPPVRLTSGVLVYSGSNRNNATITGLTPGLSYSFTLWSVDSRGNLSAATHVVMHGTITVLATPRVAPTRCRWLLPAGSSTS